MKRAKQYFSDAYLFLLDMDPRAKRQMAMEWIIAVILIALGYIWGGQWLLMAVIVFAYVIFDTYAALKYGFMDAVEITGTVTHVKWEITGRRIWIVTEESNEKEFTIPYGTVKTRICVGDRVIFFGYPLEEEGKVKIIDYRINHANRKRKSRP